MRAHTRLAILAACLGLAACRARPGEVEVKVGVNGFDPWRIEARAGKPLALIVTRTTDDTCATEMIIPDAGVKAPLPLGKPVRVELLPARTGKLRFSCAMKMFQGEIDVR